MYYMNVLNVCEMDVDQIGSKYRDPARRITIWIDFWYEHDKQKSNSILSSNCDTFIKS